MPSFLTRLDNLRYQQTLRFLRLTPEEFEASQREDLLIGKVQQFITRGTKVLDSETLSYYHHTRDEVNLAYLEADPEEFKDEVKVDEEAVRDYFDNHRDRYRVPAKRSIVYVRFAAQDYLNEVEPTAAEVEDFYQVHQEDYKEPKKVRARHILFPIGEKANTAEIQEISEKAKKVLAMARKEEDFSELARKYSKDSTAVRGGDLGYFSRNEMVKPFADSAFSMEKGEISDLVRTRFGLHIIKVEDIREETVKPLGEVKETVLQSLKKERGLEIAQQRAESFIDVSRALDDVRKAAVEEGLEAKESGFFAAEEPIPQLGRQPEINEIIFSLRPREISPAFSIGEDQLVAQLVEIQDSRLPEFAEVQEKAREEWAAEQSRALARNQAQEWLQAAQEKGSLAEVSQSKKLKLQETGLFTALSPARVLGNQRDLVITAFALTPEQPVAPEVNEVNGNFLIMQLKNRKDASEEDFGKDKDNLSKQLLAVKKDQTFNRWLTGLRQRSEIKILQEL